MANKQSLMSDALKWELAKELGVNDIVATEGWGGVPSRQCGNLVKLAIQKAEQAMIQNSNQ
ncbi:alpha/beta-type small acid-soluble spore protein [Metallumcola ferriviriculae]|uniref:Alpha/beta-type small acid-soluble spore protein n=1 Tax=Metallumcola ferriviriculae TaxID=3039180 RepID=A0AAU0ULX3_9FIRM|nr:alpha/beta-type small acid-soluble spore protein [Desulfitibacteraceae bacterium MK1]